MTPFVQTHGRSDMYDLARGLWRTSGSVDSLGRSNARIENEALQAYLNRLLAVAGGMFAEELMRHYGRVSVSGTDADFCTFEARCKVAEMREGHLDRGNKALVGLWYFRDPLDDAAGGNLTLGSQTIPYDTNVMVIFPNTPEAWHSVSPRAKAEHPRKMINFFAMSDRELHGYRRDAAGRDRRYDVPVYYDPDTVGAGPQQIKERDFEMAQEP